MPAVPGGRRIEAGTRRIATAARPPVEIVFLMSACVPALASAVTIRPRHFVEREA